MAEQCVYYRKMILKSFFISVGDLEFQFLVLEISEIYISDQIEFLNFRSSDWVFRE